MHEIHAPDNVKASRQANLSITFSNLLNNVDNFFCLFSKVQSIEIR